MIRTSPKYNRRHPAIHVAVAFLASLDRRARTLFAERDYARQRAYFSAHPEFAPTPLHHLPALARALGLADIGAKDETVRFGLNAFKAAGALFAVDALRSEGACAPATRSRAQAKAITDAPSRAPREKRPVVHVSTWRRAPPHRGSPPSRTKAPRLSSCRALMTMR
jgi:hypothetical protein